MSSLTVEASVDVRYIRGGLQVMWEMNTWGWGVFRRIDFVKVAK